LKKTKELRGKKSPNQKKTKKKGGVFGEFEGGGVIHMSAEKRDRNGGT